MIDNLGNKPNYNIFFYILFLCCWSRKFIIRWILVAFSHVPYIGAYGHFIYALVILVLILLSIPMFRRLSIGDFCMCSIVILSVLLSFLYDDNQYLSQGLYTLLISAFPFYFLGIRADIHAQIKIFRKIFEMEDILCFLAAVGVVVTFLGQFYAVSVGEYNKVYENSGAATYTMVPLCYLIFYAFKNKKITIILSSIIGVVAMISYANRAALLASFIMFIIMYVVFVKKSEYKILLIIVTAMIGGFLFLNFDWVITMLGNQLSAWGFNTRIIDILNLSKSNDLNGRETVYSIALSYIRERPLIGYGIFGDRVVYGDFNGYAHNLVLELWFDYGVVIGSIFVLGLVYLLVRTIHIEKRDYCSLGFLLSLLVPEITMLSFGGSYLVEGLFFMLIGYCFSRCRNTKNVRLVFK